MGVRDKVRARQLHSEGMACSEVGNEEGALEKYRAALELDPERSETLYLCKACSEGRPHEQHDQNRRDESWQIERRVGIACA